MSVLDPKFTAARRKRLGQFFSGVRLGRLLAGLTAVTTARSIIDPMAGTGDLLQGCLDLGAAPDVLAGIEVDGTVARQAAERLPCAEIICGDAFDPRTISMLPTLGYDLVIGNPPFVRYQDGGEVGHGLPGAARVRSNLEAAIPLFTHQGNVALAVYRDLVRQYSGLADLAVPACILSMLLVRPGGEIALVLPQAWLSRDYARPVRQALETMFDLVAVVEDDSGSWFEDALVRTALVVAQRPHSRVADRPLSGSPIHVRLKRGAADHSSLVGSLAHEPGTPELVVGKMIRRGDENLAIGSNHRYLRIRPLTGLNHLDSGTLAGSSTPGISLPAEIADALGQRRLPTCTLQDLQVVAGQGLRTGANEFFYVKACASFTACRTSAALGGNLISGIEGILRPVVRNQSKLPSEENLAGRDQDAILDLRSTALLEDLSHSGKITRLAYRPMPDDLARHVRIAAKAKSGKPGRERLIPELSAVSTNVRPERPGRAARFWYQLPAFQDRHRPDVYMPRVNAGRPRAFVNAGRRALVDANFITFRCPNDMTPESLAAVLNSVWTWAYLELVGAVMGGGALKIESAMLRRMPVPNMSADRWRVLMEAVAHKTDPWARGQVDHLMIGSLKSDYSFIEALEDVASSRLAARCDNYR